MKKTTTKRTNNSTKKTVKTKTERKKSIPKFEQSFLEGISCDIYVGKKAGISVRNAIRKAKKSITVISPFLSGDMITEDIFEEIFENDIFLDEEPEYTSIWRHDKLSKRKHLIEIDLFIRENENDNLFRKYNEIQKKFIYDPEWIIKTVQNKGFEIFDTASNPEFGESRIFFILKKL